MITAEQLTTLTTFTPEALTLAVGRKDLTFTGAQFLGITNGGQFCYRVAYPFEDGFATTKVFLTWSLSVVTADIELTAFA